MRGMEVSSRWPSACPSACLSAVASTCKPKTPHLAQGPLQELNGKGLTPLHLSLQKSRTSISIMNCFQNAFVF